MDSSKFNKNMKDQLGEHFSKDIPSELKWENISEELFDKLEQRKKKRRRILPFWFLLGSGVLAGIIVLAVNINRDLFFASNSPAKIAQFPIVSEARAFEPSRTRVGNARQEAPPTKTLTNTIPTKPTISLKSPSLLKIAPAPQGELLQKTNTLPANPVGATIIDTLQQAASTTRNDFKRSYPTLLTQLPTLDWPLLPTSYENPTFAAPERPETLQRRSWSVQFYGGINGFASNYQSTLNIVDPSPIFDEETNLTGWQIGLLLQYDLPTRWYVQSGIEWQRLRYRYEKQLVENTLVYRPNTVDTLFVGRFSGDTINTIFTDSIPGILNTQIRNYNEHLAFRIPINIGFRFIQRTNFSLSAQAGVVIHAWQRSRGITSPVSQVLDIESTELYRHRLRLSGRAALQARLRIAPKIHLTSSVGLEGHWDNWINGNDYSYQQKPFIYNGQLGIQYYW